MKILRTLSSLAGLAALSACVTISAPAPSAVPNPNPRHYFQQLVNENSRTLGQNFVQTRDPAQTFWHIEAETNQIRVKSTGQKLGEVSGMLNKLATYCRRLGFQWDPDAIYSYGEIAKTRLDTQSLGPRVGLCYDPQGGQGVSFAVYAADRQTASTATGSDGFGNATGYGGRSYSYWSFVTPDAPGTDVETFFANLAKDGSPVLGAARKYASATGGPGCSVYNSGAWDYFDYETTTTKRAPAGPRWRCGVKD